MTISRRQFLARGVAVGAGWALIPSLARAALEPGAGERVWLAGDLHCHTVYSHDVWGGPTDDNTGIADAYTLGFTPAEQIANAVSRRLDFLAITDHDDVRALADPAYLSARDALRDAITLIPGYEHSLSHGHAGCLGVDHVMIDPSTGQKIDTATDTGANALRDAVHAAGGTWVLNHPYYDKNANQSWGYSIDVCPDSIEVWNIAWPYRTDVFTSAIATSNNYESLPLWERYLDRWGRIPANGGSDNHWRSTAAAQGVGQPTTWVHARDRSSSAILDAVREGRTTVSAEPPALGGARLFLTAILGETSYEVGESVPSGGAPVEVRARVVGASGNTLSIVVDGEPLPPVTVTSADFEASVPAAPQRRVRAEVFLERGYWMTALSSPIYIS